MCGLTGFLSPGPLGKGADLKTIADRMTDTLTHRGPDSRGVWVDEDARLGLGHRRLSILDLSEAGHQPMVSRSGRFVLVYNGEIYNFKQLKQELEGLGQRFIGGSDTEVLLAGLAEWGLEDTLKKINGMFAFALWDRQTRELSLARDRLGIKPLYFGTAGGTFLFGSELKALRAHPSFDPRMDPNAVALYLRHSFIPAPWSILEGIYKLPAGCFLRLGVADMPARKAGLLDMVRPYWSMKEVAENGMAEPLRLSEGEAVSELDDLLGKAVADRLVSDVPLGAFLSGGIDSSLVVALMQKQASMPVKTFSIGFEQAGYDEAGHARQVADHLHTDHTEFYVTDNEAREVIPDLPAIYDEPFADPSQIPTWHVCHLARQEVTVALSGDGGDETFSGYKRYRSALTLGRIVRRYPLFARRTVAALAKGLPASLWNMIDQGLAGRIDTLAGLVTTTDTDSLYLRQTSRWPNPALMVRGTGIEAPSPITDPARAPAFGDPLARMMYFDTVNYLPEDILTKVDRASMAVGLEARVPLLDHRVLEFAWALPMDMKLRGTQSKWVLRQVLSRYVPPAIFQRAKQGFKVPLDGWLRGPLRDWAADLLSEGNINKAGLLNPAPIGNLWQAHQAGRINAGSTLWGILMLQAWHDSFMTNGA